MLVYGHALSRVDSSPSDITWPSLWALGAYLLVYLGGPLTSEPLVQVGTAAFFGALGLVTYALLLSRHARDRAPSHVFWSVVHLLPIGAGLMTGIGRHAIGLQYAASSRYVTISTIFWIVLLAGLALASDSTSGRDERPGRSERGIPGVVAIILVAGVVVSYGAIGSFVAWNSRMSIARAAFAEGTESEVWLRLLPDLEVLREQRVILKARRLSVFRQN